VRQRLTVFLTFVLAFAQIVTAAHACSIFVPAAQAHAMTADADRAPHGHCVEMAGQNGSASDVCSSHCFATEQADTHVDVPIMPAALQSGLTVKTIDSSAMAVASGRQTPMDDARPLPLLRSGRLRI